MPSFIFFDSARKAVQYLHKCSDIFSAKVQILTQVTQGQVKLKNALFSPLLW